MSYLDYVIAAYAVFAIALGWDFVAAQLQIRRELRNARYRVARQATQSRLGERGLDPRDAGDDDNAQSEWNP